MKWVCLELECHRGLIMNGKWLELDELENAIDNLEMASYFLEQIKSEKKWKWAIIATHQALYGFAICSIKGTSTSC